MPTDTATLPTPLTDCPVCHGTGVDEAFRSTCDCQLFVSRSVRSALAERCDVTIVTDRNHGHGATGTGTGSARPDFANKYAGACAKCGATVAAGAGLRVREGQGWATVHPGRTCPTADVATKAPAQAATARRNRFAGPCVRCGVEVPADAGLLNKIDGRWIIAHDGDCPAVPAVGATPCAPVAGLDLTGLPTGGAESMYFGVPGADTRLKVRIDRPTQGRWAGWVFVKDGAEYGIGRKYGKQAPGASYVGDIRDELAAIVADPMAALKKYAELTSHCGVCNRPLEDEVSVSRGIGPVCWGRIAGGVS